MGAVGVLHIQRAFEVLDATFVAVWTTGIGYIASTVYYQAAIIGRHPASSAAWIGGMLGLFFAVILALRWWGMRQKQRLYATAVNSA